MIASMTALLALVGSTGPVLRAPLHAAARPLVMQASVPPPMGRRAAVLGLAPILFTATTLPVEAADESTRERKRTQERKKQESQAKTRKQATDRKKAKVKADKDRTLAKATREREAKDEQKKLQKKREAGRKVRQQDIAKTKEQNKAYAVKQKKKARTTKSRQKKRGGGGLGFLGNLLALGSVGVGGLLLLPEPATKPATTAVAIDDVEIA